MTTLPSPPTPFPHWMLAEIYEQPEALRRTLGLYADAAGFRRERTDPLSAWLRAQSQLLIAGSGTSRHAGLFGEILLEDVSTLPVDVEYASEYSFRTPQARPGGGVVVISQSGETGDTLMALRHANEAGLPTLAITNVPGSTMMREATVSMPLAAGPELAIPATKSFTAQLLALALLSLLAAETHGNLREGEVQLRLEELHSLPGKIAEQLPAWQAAARRFAQDSQGASSFLFCGRDLHFPIAREGALKLKESAYVQAEAYPAGELRHGPTALVSPETPLVVLATVEAGNEGSLRRYRSVVELIRELQQHRAPVFAVVSKGDNVVREMVTATAEIDSLPEALSAICEVIPLQLMAYHFATERGIDVDRPRHLVKSVQAL